MSRPNNLEGFCPECRAVCHADEGRCWLCGHSFIAELAPEPPAYNPRARYQFGLSTLLLITTLTAIVLSVWKMAPGLAVLLTVLLVPALIRVGIASGKAQAVGQPMSWQAKTAMTVRTAAVTFGILVGIAVLLAVAGFVALWIICSGRGGFR
jgi:hypothetical protein